MPPPPPPPPPGPPGPPPMGAPKATKNSEKGRTALLSDICKGTRLKPASHLTVDKSKPILGNEGSSTTKFGTVSSRGGHKKADPVGSFGSELQKKLSSKHAKDDPPQHGHKFLRPAPTYKPHNSTAHNSSQSSNIQSVSPLTKIQCGSSQSLRDSGYGHGSDEVERSSSKSSSSGREGSVAGRHDRFPLAPTPSLSCYDMSNPREPPSKMVSRSVSMVQKPLCPPPPLPKPPNDGGPVASNTTIGPAGGRGGRHAGPPALAGLFAGGVPRPKAMASHDSTVQNGYRSTPAQRPIKPGVTISAMAPPPPPPSAACKPTSINSNQESLTGHGANGRISGLGIPSGFPAPPPSQMPRPPPPKITGNRAPPPPPPARTLDNRSLPPPPQMVPSNGKVPPPRYAPPPVPRPPGIAPPPPPARSNLPPPPPPARDQSAPSRPPANAKPQVPPVPPPVKKNSLESRFTFRNEHPPAPGTFRKSPKTYPSAVPKSTRSSGSGNRPCPPPPPV